MSTWGILGCGTIANEMAATFQKMGHEIYGVANRTPEKAEKFADKYGVKHVFKTYEEMLADENIDSDHSECSTVRRSAGTCRRKRCGSQRSNDNFTYAFV